MVRILCAMLALSVAADARWMRFDSGPFSLYTDTGERGAKETLERLQLARRVFGGLVPGTRATPLPVRVFVLSESKFRAVRSGEATRGFYQSAAQRDSIVLLAGGSPRVAFHEYVHLVLNHTSGPLPVWMEEGLAEFYSTLQVREGKVRLGVTVPEHLRLLAATPLLSAPELLGVTRSSPQLNAESHAGQFYAQSWAMVHLLRLHERYRAGFSTFVAAVERGEALGAAFQTAFGKTASEAVSELRAYLDRTMLPVVDMTVDLGGGAEESAPLELAEFDGELAYAELARECGRQQEAARIFARLMRNQPPTATGETALAWVALAADRRDEARTRFEKSFELGSRDSAAAFEHAMLMRDSGAPRADVRKLLERVVDWNPQHAEAQFLLGVEDAHENRHAEAVRRMELALNVLPRQSYFWHALALSLHALGKTEQARAAAQRALDSATAPEQAEMARAAMARVDGAAAPAKKDAAVIVPDSWKQKEGNERMEGLLERIDCLGRSARFHVRAGGALRPLWVENPGEVLLKNASSITFEFRCGVQKPVPVVVEYEKKADAEKATFGVVTSIEFR